MKREDLRKKQRFLRPSVRNYTILIRNDLNAGAELQKVISLTVRVAKVTANALKSAVKACLSAQKNKSPDAQDIGQKRDFQNFSILPSDKDKT